MKYVEKTVPPMVVEIDIWDPANGKNHVAVTPMSGSDGMTGTIFQPDDEENITGIIPPMAIVTWPGSPTKYTKIKPEDIPAYFDKYEEPRAPVTAKKLTATRSADSE